MREILFRGKLRADGRWAEGNLAVSKDGVCIITPDDTPLGCYGQVDPDTVGQYTGMTDKNGKKIFEGDCLGNPHNVVEYVDGCFTVAGDRWLSLRRGIFEVVGNIYDNSDSWGERSKQDGN